MANSILTITGHSFSGKTHLLKKLLESGKYVSLISHTTRLPRAGEVDGVDYHFTDLKAFNKLDLVEKALFDDCMYGLSRAELDKVIKTGKIPVMIVNPDGLLQIQNWSNINGYDLQSLYIYCNDEEFIFRVAERIIKAKSDRERDLIRKRVQKVIFIEKAWALDFKYTWICSNNNVNNMSVILKLLNVPNEYS